MVTYRKFNFSFQTNFHANLSAALLPEIHVSWNCDKTENKIVQMKNVPVD